VSKCEEEVGFNVTDREVKESELIRKKGEKEEVKRENVSKGRSY